MRLAIKDEGCLSSTFHSGWWFGDLLLLMWQSGAVSSGPPCRTRLDVGTVGNRKEEGKRCWKLQVSKIAQRQITRNLWGRTKQKSPDKPRTKKRRETRKTGRKDRVQHENHLWDSSSGRLFRQQEARLCLLAVMGLASAGPQPAPKSQTKQETQLTH